MELYRQNLKISGRNTGISWRNLEKFSTISPRKKGSWSWRKIQSGDFSSPALYVSPIWVPSINFILIAYSWSSLASAFVKVFNVFSVSSNLFLMSLTFCINRCGGTESFALIVLLSPLKLPSTWNLTAVLTSFSREPRFVFLSMAWSIEKTCRDMSMSVWQNDRNLKISRKHCTDFKTNPRRLRLCKGKKTWRFTVKPIDQSLSASSATKIGKICRSKVETSKTAFEFCWQVKVARDWYFSGKRRVDNVKFPELTGSSFLSTRGSGMEWSGSDRSGVD